MFFNIPGMHFSSINHAMVSQCDSDSINLFWNEQMESNKAKMMMFMTPTFDVSIGWEFKEFGMYGNQLINPLFTVQQCLYKWQNNGMDYNLNNFNLNGIYNNFQNPWQLPTSPSNDANKTDAEREAEAKVKDEIKYLKEVLKEVKTIAKDDLDSETLRKIDLALKKQSSKKTTAEKNKEILESLQNAYKAIDKDVVKKVLPTMVDVETTLFDTGFEFNSDYGYEFKPENYGTKSADNTSEEVRNLKIAISRIKPDCQKVPESEITKTSNVVKLISTWNNDYNKPEEKSIIRAMNAQINKFPSDADKVSDKKQAVEGNIKPLVLALQSNVEDLIKKHAKIFENGTAKADIETIIKDTTSLLGTAMDAPTAENLENLAKKFDELYLAARKIGAMAAQKTIANKYAFIDDIEAGTNDDIFTEDLFKDATTADLKKEGFKGDDLKFNKFVLKQQTKPKETVTKDILEEKGDKVKVKNKNNVTIDAYEYNNNYYRIKSDGTIVELTGVTKIENSEEDTEQENEITVEKLRKEGKKATAKKGDETLNKYEFYQLGDKYYYIKDEKVIEVPTDKGIVVTVSESEE